jgi:hypothetical protein
LSPFLRCLVVEDLIARLSEGGVQTRGYADDIFLLAVGRFPDTVLEHTQCVLHNVEVICGEFGLSVNPDMTELVFTRKRQLLVSLTHCSLELLCTVLCPRVVLDSQLTWRKHGNINVKKAHNSQ